MMGVLDTNVILHVMNGQLAEPLPSGRYAASVITEIEIFSFPLLDEATEARLRAFFVTVSVMGIDPAVRDAAIRLRREHRLKIPDAIIAATALVLDVSLMSNDGHFADIPGLRCTAVAIKA